MSKLDTPTSETAPRQAPIVLVWDVSRLRFSTDTAGICLWSWNVDTDQISMDERAHELWGIPPGYAAFEDLSARIQPEDFDRVRAAFAARREILAAYEEDFHILHGRTYDGFQSVDEATMRELLAASCSACSLM